MPAVYLSKTQERQARTTRILRIGILEQNTDQKARVGERQSNKFLECSLCSVLNQRADREYDRACHAHGIRLFGTGKILELLRGDGICRIAANREDEDEISQQIAGSLEPADAGYDHCSGHGQHHEQRLQLGRFIFKKNDAEDHRHDRNAGDDDAAL